jgi:hypothetical protein
MGKAAVVRANQAQISTPQLDPPLHLTGGFDIQLDMHTVA